jgi:hypothetical protein
MYYFFCNRSQTFAVFGMIITVAQATAYVMSGMYGDVSDLGFFNASIIILQLCTAGIIVLLLVCFVPSKLIF